MPRPLRGGATGCLARPHAAPALHRWQDRAGRDQQPRKHVSEDAIDPRRKPPWPTLSTSPRRLARGRAGCSPELIPRSSWRWPPSRRGSPGRCCARAATSTIRSAGKLACQPDHRQRQKKRQGRARGLRRCMTESVAVDPASRRPGQKSGARHRALDEARDARDPSWPGPAPRDRIRRCRPARRRPHPCRRGGP